MAKDNKDISVLVEGQLPEFVTANHPKFKKFIEKYYEFMESHQLYFDGVTFHEFKLLPEDEDFEFFIYEDDDRIQLESERDTASNANLQFVIGETVTGNNSGATAVVTGTKGNTHAFVKPSNNAVFQYAETITGGTSRAYSTLANGILDGTFPTGAIESFRSRGPTAATRELADMQDIDKTNEGLIDDAWKKEFYTNVPRTTLADRRQLLKRMKQVYRSKGNESSFTWLFRTVYAKEDVEFYYPKTDIMRLSDGKWTLDKTIKIVTSGATNIGLFTGRRITGAISKCSAIVEKAITSAVGSISITEMTLSDIVQGTGTDGVLGNFRVNEQIDTEVDTDGNSGSGTASGLVKSIQVDVGGTEYSVGDEITITGGGGQNAKAKVATIAENVVEGITILDSGDGFSVGDRLTFSDEGTGGEGAAGRVATIIKTGEVIINSDVIGDWKTKTVSESDYSAGLKEHNANTHMFGNSSLVFQSTIKTSSAKYFDSTSPMWNTQFITAGDQLRKQVTIDETSKAPGTDSSIGQLTQSGTTVTFATGMHDAQRRDVVGAKLTYANSNTTIITGYTNATVFSVKDTHTISSGQDWDIYYGSNTTWATIIGANSSQILYSVGSYYRDPDLDVFSANNFANNDYVVVYDASRTKAWAAKSANSHDAHMMHTGVIFQVGNTPASINTHSEAATANISYVDAFGQTGEGNTVTFVTRGALNTLTKNIGAVNSCIITAGGSGYQSEPLVTVANSYIAKLGNPLDIMGANNHLLNLNLHSYDTGTITQTSNTITLTGGSFPDANSGILKLTYANGSEDHITAVTNSTSLRTSLEKNFGINDDPQTYSLTYMAMANNFARGSYLYNDDYSARAVVLDFIDKSKEIKPPIATGNTTLRLDMLTAQDFSNREQFLQYEVSDFLDLDFLTFEDGNKALLEDCVEFLSQEDGLGVMLFEDGFRIFNESTSSERITAYSTTVSTASSGTITQSGTTITLSGDHFPNDVVRGTITYSGHDDSTAIVTGYTNSTVITVDTSKTVNASNTYSIDYNGVVTWGINREVTAAGSGTGNRTITITDTAHYLRSGDKVKITGALSAFVNGTHVIEVIDADSYRFTLPHDGVASVTGEIRSRGVASAWLTNVNAYTVDSSPKGNNATLSVSAIAIGAIKTVSVYNFGAGYTEAPTLTTTTGNRNAELSATLGAFAEYDGYYVGSTGLISGTPKIQDNFYYQDFSYVLKTDMDITDYRDQVKRLTHPSGMLLFGEVSFRNKVSVEMFDAGERNVNSTDDDVAKTAMGYSPKYRLTVPTINSYANLRHQNTATLSSGGYESYLDPKGGILELHTASHPWQAMDGKIDIRGDENLLYENFRDVTMQRTSAIGSNAYATITETLHNLEVGDTVVISGDAGQWASEGDYFNGKYTVYSVPTTNTYTVYMYRGDPGASVSASAYLYVYMEVEDGQILLEDGRTSSSYASVSLLGNVLNEYSDDDVLDYVKVETTAFANNFRADPSNWSAPFNTAPIDELDSGRWVLEHGGSYLYPPIEFPMAESGTVSIDMSFNSDLLMEDHGYDTGLSDSGYILTEDTGGSGTGPARYISLEEDTEGIEEGHIAQNIPYMETEVITNLLDSMRQGLVTEDGLDDLVLESLATDTHDLFMEDGFKLLQDDGRTGYDSASELGFLVVEFEESSWSTRPIERRRFITEPMPITNGSYYPIMYIDHLSTIGKIITEDGALLTNEDGKTYVRVERPYYMATTRDREYEFYLYENAGYNLVLEDGSHLIVEGDETAQTLSRIQTEENHVKTWGSEVEFDLVESLAYHLVMEDNSHHIYEDGKRAITEGRSPLWADFAGEIEYIDHFSTSILDRILYEDGDIIFGEDNAFLQQEVDSVSGNTEIQFNLYENADYNLILEDGSHLIEEGDEAASRLSRIGTEEGHVKTPGHEIIIDMHGEVLSFEDGSGYFITEGATPNRILVAPTVPGIKSGQSSYMKPSQLSGTVAIAHNGTTVTGSGTAFSTELAVGDVFQTSDENIILEAEGSDQQVILETDELLVYEDIQITEVSSDVISFVSGVPIEHFKWYISKEDTNKSVFAASGTNVIGNYGINTVDEQFNIVGEDSNQDLEISLESNTPGQPGVLEQETSEFTTGISLLLEDDEKMLFTEPGEFKISSITNDTSLVVTRKHWGGTDVVPFWKQTTETEVSATVSYL